MSDTGREEPITRYLMYKVALNSGDHDLGKACSACSYALAPGLTDNPAAECLESVCRQSSKDATLLYACVLEAQNFGNRREAILALEKVLDKYDYSAPTGIHLPALLR
jgi:hypothetical protein